MSTVFASSSAIDVLFSGRAEALRKMGKVSSTGREASPPIRRPYRGIQIKDDTYATMQIVDGAGNPIKLISESYTGDGEPAGGKGAVDVYADFILQQITEERVEKQQIIETFGDSFVFFFGERPRMLSVQGILVNTEDFGWRAQFMHNYDEYLRGSRLVQRNARMFLSWDTIVIEGYPINVSASENSENPYIVNFQMQVFLTNYKDFGRIGITEFPGQDLGKDAVSALNRELSDKSQYISSALEVRRLNFESRGGSGGLGSYIREGIKKVNSIFGIADQAIQSISTTLSGRVVRKPIGIAGFLNQVGGGLISASGVSQALIDQFGYGGLTDVKLRIPRRTLYVEPLIIRGKISDNWDEYPLYEQFDAGGVLTGKVRNDAWVNSAARARRDFRNTVNLTKEATLVAANLLAEAEAGVLDSIQDTVSLVKTGFAIFNTARAVAADPYGVTADALGLTGVISFG